MHQETHIARRSITEIQTEIGNLWDDIRKIPENRCNPYYSLLPPITQKLYQETHIALRSVTEIEAEIEILWDDICIMSQEELRPSTSLTLITSAEYPTISTFI